MKTILLFAIAATAAAQSPSIYPLEGAVPAAVATDQQGNIYVVGQTSDALFPVTANALQPTLKGGSDAFISKISPAGALVWSTYFGGSGNDSAAGVAIDSAGNVLVGGTTDSTDLPVLNAYQSTLGGHTDVFALKLDPNGKVLYCTYLGGSDDEGAAGLAVDYAGAAYIVGYTASPNFPGKSSITYTRGFAVKLAPTGALVYTYQATQNFVGYSAIAVDGLGSAYIAGSYEENATTIRTFVLKLSPDGSTPVYQSKIGGSQSNHPAAIAVDSNGSAYVAGRTTSVDLPVVNPVQSTLGARPLWKSTDGGASWTPIDNLPFAALQALVPDPKALRTLYAVASDTGIFKSTDDGNTWSAINNGIDDSLLNQLAVNPANTSVMYTGGLLGHVYRTVDGGANWSLVHSLDTALTQLAVDPQKPTTVYAPPSVSTDGGSTWSALNGLSFGMMQFLVDPVTEGTLYAYNTGFCCLSHVLPALYRSIDAGNTWQEVNNNAYGPAPIADPTTKPATIYDGVGARSNDGGTTWTPLTPPPGITYSNAMAADPQTGAIYAAAGPPNGPITLDASTNQGQSWTQLKLPSGMPLITGITPTPGALFVTSNATFASAFVLKLSPDGSTVTYSTYLRGHGGTQATGIAIDAAGNMAVAGSTQSPDFPTVHAPQSTLAGSQNGFVSLISPDGQKVNYSTYLGGAGSDAAAAVTFDPQGNLIVAGTTSSTNLLGNAVPQGKNGSGFVAKLAVTAAVTPPVITKVVSAASFEAPIEAGSWVMIQGTDLANSQRLWQTSDFDGANLPKVLDGVSVTIDNQPAYVEYISPTQINVLAPTDSATGTVNVVVTNNGHSSAPATAQLQAVAPAFFMTPSYNVIASVLPNYTLVTANAPAHPGDMVVLWCTGLGPTTPPAPAGSLVSGAPATATPVVTVGGLQVQVISSVLTTGAAGLYQITIQLPANVPTGTVAIQASIGNASTQSGVTLFVGTK